MSIADRALLATLLAALLFAASAEAKNSAIPIDHDDQSLFEPARTPTNKSILPERPTISPRETATRTFRPEGSLLRAAQPTTPRRVDRQALYRRMLGMFSSDPRERAASAVALPRPGYPPRPSRLPTAASAPEPTPSSPPVAAQAPGDSPTAPPRATAPTAPQAKRWVPAALLLGTLVVTLAWLLLMLRLYGRAR